MSTVATNSYQHESNGWTLTVTKSSLGNTILMFTGHGQDYELVHPTGDPFDIKAKGYEIQISKELKDPSVMWKRSMRESVFVWLTFPGIARWVEPDLTLIDKLDPL